jgi:uncharacterized membrane protein (DUF2068 family)
VFGRKRKHRTHLLGWHPETFVCSRHGHVTPAALVEKLRPEDAGLGVDLPDGRRMARCTRCDVWIATTPPEHPVRETLKPLPEMKVPRRGKVLREAIILRLIAINRAVHSVLFGLLATVLILLELNLGTLHDQAARILRDLAGDTGQQAGRGFIGDQLAKLLNLDKNTVVLLAATATAYCVLEAVEAVGLWRERRWAEYLTAIATAGFLPFEIHELIDRITVIRIGALVVNLAILVWLVWRKRLFGVNGGVKAIEAERDQVDRQALFGAPKETGAVVTR